MNMRLHKCFQSLFAPRFKKAGSFSQKKCDLRAKPKKNSAFGYTVLVLYKVKGFENAARTYVMPVIMRV
jgi:hypothetical protein